MFSSPSQSPNLSGVFNPVPSSSFTKPKAKLPSHAIQQTANQFFAINPYYSKQVSQANSPAYRKEGKERREFGSPMLEKKVSLDKGRVGN